MHVLACIDLGAATDQVLLASTNLAVQLEANLTLLHVAAPAPDFVGYDVGPDTVRDAVAKGLRDEHRQLEACREAARAQCEATRALMVQGPTIDKIIEYIDRFDTSYVVLGSRATSILHDLVAGSVTRGVIRRSRVPVVVVPVIDG